MSMLRHTLATLAYRAGRALRDVPEEAAEFRAASGSRTPLEILAHMGDLLDWALSMAAGHPAWHDSAPQSWEPEKQRFFDALRRLDEYLASGQPLHTAEEKLFQGPVADALTHTGQINLLRRLAGAATRGENFYLADIVEGRVGVEQSKPRREFE